MPVHPDAYATLAAQLTAHLHEMAAIATDIRTVAASLRGGAARTPLRALASRLAICVSAATQDLALHPLAEQLPATAPPPEPERPDVGDPGLKQRREREDAARPTTNK